MEEDSALHTGKPGLGWKLDGNGTVAQWDKFSSRDQRSVPHPVWFSGCLLMNKCMVRTSSSSKRIKVHGEGSEDLLDE